MKNLFKKIMKIEMFDFGDIHRIPQMKRDIEQQKHTINKQSEEIKEQKTEITKNRKEISNKNQTIDRMDVVIDNKTQTIDVMDGTIRSAEKQLKKNEEDSQKNLKNTKEMIKKYVNPSPKENFSGTVEHMGITEKTQNWIDLQKLIRDDYINHLDKIQSDIDLEIETALNNGATLINYKRFTRATIFLIKIAILTIIIFIGWYIVKMVRER